MTKRVSRAWTAEEKPQILEEARQPNTSVAEVLRRHRVDGTTLYRWEREAKAAMREALSGKTRRAADRKDEEIARLKADIDKKRLIIAEVVEENLVLKKGSEIDRAHARARRDEAGRARAGAPHAGSQSSKGAETLQFQRH